MTKLLKKEIKLTSSPLSYFFILFSLMAFIPNYPILLCAFFVCFGIFHSFQSGREASDILYTALLPVEKSDVVKSKYAFSIFIQLSGFLLLILAVAVRMLLMKDAVIYLNNTLMNANIALLGYYLIICALFNLTFICSFFKTAYKIGIPFLCFCIFSFIAICAAETLHYIPGLEMLNSTGFETIQLIPLFSGIVIYTVITVISISVSKKRFELIDL